MDMDVIAFAVRVGQTSIKMSGQLRKNLMPDLFILVKWYQAGGYPSVTTADRRTIVEAFWNAMDAHKLGVLHLADMHIYQVSKPGVVRRAYSMQNPP